MLQYELNLVDDRQIEFDFSEPKFNPKTLHDLVNFCYDTWSDERKDHEITHLLEDDHSKGRFWEKCLSKAMKDHTRLLERNAWYMDFDDRSDAKFATSSRNDAGAFQATINYGNKVGPLRVCLCVVGQHIHKVYFLMIPHEYYSTLRGHPIKITFSNFRPIGKIWEKFQCSWADVTKKL